MFQIIYGWIFSSSTSFIQDGYSTISFIGLYLLARYLKTYKPKFIKFRIEIDFIIVFGLILLVTALYLLSPEVGHRFLSYISPTTLIITMFTVVAFNKFRLNSKFINWYAASSFAVFLFHTNPNVIWHYVSVCEKLFNISATHVLDPTMLLNKNDYVDIALSNGTIASPGNLLTYILDPCLDADYIINGLVRDGYQLNKVALRVNPTKDNFRPRQVSVEQWLRGFYEAKLIVTDSFHACVFSIIFQKPFIVIGNQERRNARIDSLLKVFNLQMRKVLSVQDFERRKNELIRKMDDNAIMEVLSNYRFQSDIFFSRSGLS